MNNYHIDLQAIYHSNDNIGFGIALNEQSYAINFAYDVTNGQISKYTNHTFGVGIKLNISNK